MTNHPITPPPELVQQWRNQAPEGMGSQIREMWIAIQAVQYGADQELEACCHYFARDLRESLAQDLRTARRPKPPSLKKQAQVELDRLIALIPTKGAIAMAEPIRRALEALPE